MNPWRYVLFGGIVQQYHNKELPSFCGAHLTLLTNNQISGSNPQRMQKYQQVISSHPTTRVGRQSYPLSVLVGEGSRYPWIVPKLAWVPPCYKKKAYEVFLLIFPCVFCLTCLERRIDVIQMFLTYNLYIISSRLTYSINGQARNHQGLKLRRNITL